MWQALSILCIFLTRAALGYSYQSGSTPSSHLTTYQPESKFADSAAANRNGNLEKSFYFFSAPEELEETIPEDVSRHLIPELRKNIQIVFIKAPENNHIERAALRLAQAAVEQKTHIYVLSKEPDLSQLSHQLGNHVQSPLIEETTGPEVHFIKYRTTEEAQRAQEAILQYYSDEPLNGQQQQQRPQQYYHHHQQHQQQQQQQENLLEAEGRVHENPLHQRLHSQLDFGERQKPFPPSFPTIVDLQSPTAIQGDQPQSQPPSLAITGGRTDDSPWRPISPIVDSLPVNKNYARNFLPTDIDVVPGSSYIPLVRRK